MFLVNSDHVNSPPSLCVLDKQPIKENGTAKTPLDEATRAKAEGRYPAYYEYFHDEPESTATGTAPFQ